MTLAFAGQLATGMGRAFLHFKLKEHLLFIIDIQFAALKQFRPEADIGIVYAEDIFGLISVRRPGVVLWIRSKMKGFFRSLP